MSRWQWATLLFATLALAGVVVGGRPEREGTAASAARQEGREAARSPERSAPEASGEPSSRSVPSIRVEQSRPRTPPGPGSRPRGRLSLEEANRLPLGAHQRRSEVSPPPRPSLDGADALSRELRQIVGSGDRALQTTRLERRLKTVRDPAQLERVALLLASLSQERAVAALDALVREGRGGSEVARVEAALRSLGQVAPSVAMTSASELLNSNASSEVKQMAARYLVALVGDRPYLATPALSTLHYAQESEADPAVRETMREGEAQIREDSARRGRDLPALR